jgi:tRNA 2-thiocytidine biosynthesis protein TtcA
MNEQSEFRGDPDRIAYFLLKAVSKANRLYRLFEAGDRIAIAVSGGKDSATLLELLRRWPGVPRFEIAAIHVTSPEAACGAGVTPGELAGWFNDLGIENRIVPLEPPAGEPTRAAQRPCFHCAWRRRKALFTAARELGCNKLALAHHADDVAVTTLLNLVYQGRFETMQPVQPMFDGALTLIRPLYLLEEREIVRFARSGPFPFSPATCESEADERRSRMTEVLRDLERENRRVKRSFMNALEYASPPPARRGK